MLLFIRTPKVQTAEQRQQQWTECLRISRQLLAKDPVPVEQLFAQLKNCRYIGFDIDKMDPGTTDLVADTLVAWGRQYTRNSNSLHKELIGTVVKCKDLGTRVAIVRMMEEN